jgi:hypothetical protein
MPKQNLVPVHFVESAMQMLRHFCVKYGAEHELPGCATHITIALREQSNFEWTPCARGFRRIIFITPEMRDEKWTAVLVFNYENFDRKLTDELNESIRRACDNRWADA